MNRLRHAHQAGQGHHTDLWLQVDSDSLQLRLEDEGPAFDPTQARHPGLPTTLDDATPGGLGLLLIRKAVSAWHYERLQGRNCLSLQLSRH